MTILLRHSEFSKSARPAAHTKHLGWCVDLGTRGTTLRIQVLELTDGKPGLSTGTMIVDDSTLGPAHQVSAWRT